MNQISNRSIASQAEDQPGASQRSGKFGQGVTGYQIGS